MSEQKAAPVKEHHRDIAYSAYAPLGASAVGRAWVKTGVVSGSGLGGVYLPDVAQLIADAEARGRAAERASLARLDSAHWRHANALLDGEHWGPVQEALNALQDLRSELGLRGEHVGAAGVRPPA